MNRGIEIWLDNNYFNDANKNSDKISPLVAHQTLVDASHLGRIEQYNSRLNGCNDTIMWAPGTDDCGLATQSVVKLPKEGKYLSRIKISK